MLKENILNLKCCYMSDNLLMAINLELVATAGCTANP